MAGRLKVFAGTAGLPLAQKVCERLSIELGKAKVTRFNDGEVNIQLQEDVRESDVFIITPTNPPAENLIELALLSEAAHDSSASRITIVPTYMGYNRQDRKDKPRAPISAYRMMRFLAESGADRALLFDLHSEPTAAYFKPQLVVDHLHASMVSIPYLKKLLQEPFVVASPDKGGGARAEAYKKMLGKKGIAYFSKVRSESGEVDEDQIMVIGDVEGKEVLFVFFIIDTAGTIIADARAAMAKGATKVYVFATHALLSKDALKKLNESPITEIIITDTVYHDPEKLKAACPKITVLSIAELLAKAIRRINGGQSLSELFLI